MLLVSSFPVGEEQAMKKVVADPMPSMREFERRAEAFRDELQKALLPEHAAEVLAINVDTGEYLLAPTRREAWQAFRKRWPGTLSYICRVDGGPVVKFHGR
jgi:hypothetical protein